MDERVLPSFAPASDPAALWGKPQAGQDGAKNSAESLADTAAFEARRRAPLWFREGFRRSLAQAAALLVVLLIFLFFAHNAIVNTAARSLGIGFEFLGREAGFGIGQSIIPYSPTDTYLRAFIVGLLNTIRVSAVAIVLATLIGFSVGAGLLSFNAVLRRLCAAYVEAFRNVPLLLQLYLWYSVVIGLFPPPTAAFALFSSIFVSKAGVMLPRPILGTAAIWVFAASVAAGFILWRFHRRRRLRLGAAASRWPIVLLALLLVGNLAYILSLPLEIPEWKRFRFAGGIQMSAEFATMAFGLSIYTGAFIAEIVRAGILSISRGQREAARALGLSPWQTLRFVKIPQAMRVIVPPLTSQYLNLVKNSSLAVAIGYADLVSVANTSLTQTARAIECITILMAVYLVLSLLISLVMNLYNRRLAARGR